MDWATIEKFYLLIFVVVIAVPATTASLAVIIYCLQERISRISVSRNSFELHTNDTNDLLVWSGIVGELHDKDLETSKSIRKGTTGLKILDLEKYGVSAETLIVNRKAIEPLICAAYENHHTREITNDNGHVYLENKSNEIFDSIKVYQNQFPGVLTEERADSFANYWVQCVLVANLRKACNDKIELYKKYIARKDVSKTIKDILSGLLKKNEYYIVLINDLANISDIKAKTGIFTKATS